MVLVVDGNIHQVVYSVHVSNEQGSRRLSFQIDTSYFGGEI